MVSIVASGLARFPFAAHRLYSASAGPECVASQRRITAERTRITVMSR